MTDMEQLVKKVSRAILKARFYDCEPDMYPSLDAFYDDIEDDHGDDARIEARAAIAAVQENAAIVPDAARVTNPMRLSVLSAYESVGDWVDSDPKALAWDFFAVGYYSMLAASPYREKNDV